MGGVRGGGGGGGKKRLEETARPTRGIVSSTSAAFKGANPKARCLVIVELKRKRKDYRLMTGAGKRK